MGRLHRRLAARSSAALETPFSWMFLLSLVTLALIWRIYTLYIWTAASCAEAVAWTFGPGRYDIAIIDLFTLAFLACLALWFFNLVRFRSVPQSWTRRGVEFLLIGFCLLVSVTWAGTARPHLPETRAAQWARGVLARTPIGLPAMVQLGDTEAPWAVTADGRSWYDDFDFNPHDVDDADYPVGIFTRPASECFCWSKWEEYARRERFRADWYVREGFLTAEEAAGLYAPLPPAPTEPHWCKATLELALPGA